VESGEKAVVTVDALGKDLTYTWYYANEGSDAFVKTGSFTGDTYSVKMTAARNGRQVYCVVTDAFGNEAKTEVFTLTIG